MVGEKLASDAMLDKVLCICSGRWPIETCTEGLAYKGPSRGVVTTETGMNFSQELSPLFLGDISLEYSKDISPRKRGDNSWLKFMPVSVVTTPRLGPL